MITTKLLLGSKDGQCLSCGFPTGELIRIRMGDEQGRATAYLCRSCATEMAEQVLAILIDKSITDKDVLPCGHPVVCIVRSDEGTHYCGWCEDKAEANLFRSCVERAMKMWRDRHQDAVVFVDGARAIADLLDLVPAG